MNYLRIKIFSIFFLLVFPCLTFATEIRFDSHKANLKVGEQFFIDVVVVSDKQLNAIEGRILYPDDFLFLKDISNGDSIINLWVTEPNLESPGSVFFSGITPGGFSGTENLIFRMSFEVKKSGDFLLNFSEVETLVNDGLGTQEDIDIRNISLVATEGDSNIRKAVIYDTEPPEDFMPIVFKYDDIHEGQNILVFTTQDKKSGIDSYFVKEFHFKFISFLSPWKNAKTPYVLKDQNLKSYIMVKAVDMNGNERIAGISPQNSLSWKDYAKFAGIIFMLVCFCVLALRKVCQKD